MNRFDLENAIMACWNTVDDIRLLAESELPEEELLNGLVGLERLHDLRCKKVFDIFEKLIETRAIR